MKEKLKALFDNRITWATIGSVVGALFGQHGAEVANAVGVAVMAIL